MQRYYDAYSIREENYYNWNNFTLIGLVSISEFFALATIISKKSFNFTIVVLFTISIIVVVASIFLLIESNKYGNEPILKENQTILE